jgi:hypothetical protein
MKKLILLLLILCPLPASAGSALLQTAVSHITYLQAEDRHRISHVWSGHFKALNGDSYNMAHLYQSRKPQLNMRLGIRLFESAKLRLALPVHFDNGFEAILYEAEPFFGTGITALWVANDRLAVSFQLHDALQIGGKVKETPCRDGLLRSFHCGTGLPWTDAQERLRKNLATPSAQLSLQWRF